MKVDETTEKELLTSSLFELADNEKLLFEKEKAQRYLQRILELYEKERLEDWLSQKTQKVLDMQTNDPKRFFKELQLRAQTHPKINELLKEAEALWKEALKGHSVHADFSFLGLFLILFQNMSNLIKTAQAIAKDMERSIKLGTKHYELYKIEKIANEYLKEKGIILTAEEKRIIEEKLRNLWHSDRKIDKEEIYGIVDSVVNSPKRKRNETELGLNTEKDNETEQSKENKKENKQPGGILIRHDFKKPKLEPK